MNEVNHKYVVTHNQTKEVVSTKNTRAAARAVYSLCGGAANGYSLTQVTTVTIKNKIR